MPSEVGLLDADDADQLEWCIKRQRVLITCNISDFYHLHTRLLTKDESHHGIVAVQQQTMGIGERMRRLIKLWSELSAEDMGNRIEFLSHWG